MAGPDRPSSTAAEARRAVLARSAAAERFALGDRPLTRGWSHLAAAVVAVPTAGIAIAAVPAGRVRVAVAGFALGVTLMFVASAMLHLRRWSPATCERFLRLDHTGIYLAIGGTGLAIGALGLTGWPSTVLMTAAVVGATVGIGLEWLPFAPPPGYSNAFYLTLGWIPVVLLPWVWWYAGPRTVGLMLAGGVLYTAGAIIVGLRRPRLVPHVFGHHELFHVLVIAAVGLHAWMIADLVTRLR